MLMALDDSNAGARIQLAPQVAGAIAAKSALNVSPISQPRAAIQQVAPRPSFAIIDMDGALRELGERGAGLGLVVDGEGRAVGVREVATPIPYTVTDSRPTWPKPIEGMIPAQLNFEDTEREWMGRRSSWPKAKCDVELAAAAVVPAEGFVS
jgi:hypothetical protein